MYTLLYKPYTCVSQDNYLVIIQFSFCTLCSLYSLSSLYVGHSTWYHRATSIFFFFSDPWLLEFLELLLPLPWRHHSLPLLPLRILPLCLPLSSSQSLSRSSLQMTTSFSGNKKQLPPLKAIDSNVIYIRISSLLCSLMALMNLQVTLNLILNLKIGNNKTMFYFLGFLYR